MSADVLPNIEALRRRDLLDHLRNIGVITADIWTDAGHKEDCDCDCSDLDVVDQADELDHARCRLVDALVDLGVVTRAEVEATSPLPIAGTLGQLW